MRPIATSFSNFCVAVMMARTMSDLVTLVSWRPHSKYVVLIRYCLKKGRFELCIVLDTNYLHVCLNLGETR